MSAQLPVPPFPLRELALEAEANLAARTVLIPQADATARTVPLAELWSGALRSVQPRVSPSDWETWLKPTVLLDVGEGEAIIGTPNIFVRQEVEQHYADVLQEVLQDALCRQVGITVVIAGGAI